jgi:cation:H+ antiporter
VLALGFLGADAYFGQGTSNILSRGDGAILLLFFAIFLYYVYTISRGESNDDTGIKKYSLPLSAIFIIGGLVGLFFGGKMFVDGAVTIARSFGMSEMVIGLTIVAVGTSLPEFATSIIAAKKGHNDIAV